MRKGNRKAILAATLLSPSGTQESTVQAVESLSDIQVLAGVSFYRLPLPETVEITLSDSSTEEVAVTWNIGSYDYTVVDTYTLQGTLTLPEGVTNPSNITAEVDIVVSYSPFTTFSNKAFSLLSTWRSTLMVESVSGVALTDVINTGDNVGFGYSMSPNALIWYAPSDALRPTYSSDGGLVFNGSKRLVIPSSVNIFKGLYAEDQTWTIRFKVKKATGSDDTQVNILDSINNSGSNNGIAVRIDNLNRIAVRLAAGGSGLTNTANTTATVTEADGIVPVTITRSGTTLSIKVGSNSTETFTISNSFIDAAMTNDLAIGQTSAGQSGFNGTLYDMEILNIAVSDAETTAYNSYLPGVVTTEFPIILQQKYDPSDSGNVWADTSRTTPATNGNGVALIDHPVRNNFGDQYLYFASQSTSGQRPLLVTNDLGSKSSLSLDGGDDRLVMSRGYQSGGKFTNFKILQYTGDEDTDGNAHTQFSTGSSSIYYVITENIYHDNYEEDFGNIVAHDSVGNAVAMKVNRRGPNLENLHNLFVFQRNGGTAYFKNGAKEMREGGSTTFTGVFGLNAIGSDATDAAHVTLEEYYIGLATDRQINDMIDAINAEFGI